MPLHCANHRLVNVVLATVLSAAAWADKSGNATLALNTFLNLDAGVVNSVGGDVLWNGTALMPQGRAGLYNLGKSGSRVFKSIPGRYTSAASYSAEPIFADKLVVGDIFGVHTNSGNYAKVIVTANNGTSLSLQYKTFIANVAAADAAPIITRLQNNYSFILPGLPNYGIAPGSLFAIFGTGLSTSAPPVLQSSAAPGLPKTLNETSASVTVNGVTTTPALYYTSATAVAAVLPSTTPVGSGTITLTYNGQSSSPAPIQVIPSAVGLDTVYGTGAGRGIITDASFKVLGLTNSATPGQHVVLWGSGVGADTSNDDRTFPQNQNNLTSVPMQVIIGGISADILYRGRSQYPGVDQINVAVPANVTPGCYVSVVVVTGSTTSNTVTLPVNPNGGPCSDPASGLSGSRLQSLAEKGATAVNSGAVTVSQNTSPAGTVTATAALYFVSVEGAEYGAGYLYASEGGCVVVEPGLPLGEVLQGALDAGTIHLNGPSGGLAVGGGAGFYSGQLPAGSATNFAGTYTFTGSGGKDVGSFEVAVNVPSPFHLTNTGVLASITRSLGSTLSWSGGFPNGDVQVSGAASTQAGTASFLCHAPSSAGQLTIPPSILLGLPAAAIRLNVTNITAPQTVSATGLDVALAFGSVTFQFNSTLK